MIELTQEELAAEIEAGYNDETAELAGNDVDQAEGQQDEQQEHEDPWANVPEVIRNEFNVLKTKAESVEKLEARLRKSEGHIGDLIKKIKQAPTPEQIEAENRRKEAQEQEAAELAKLEEVDPEIAQAIKATRNQITEKFAGLPDSGKIMADVEERINSGILTTKKEIINDIIDGFHPGWEETVKTPDFIAFMNASQEMLALAASPRPRDAIKMLNAYNDHKKPVDPRVQRLNRAAQTPKVNSSTRPKSNVNLTPEEQRAFDIQAGYDDA